MTFSREVDLAAWLESLSRRLSSSEVQTRTCESAGRDDDVWPVLPDHKTCLGHAGVHGRRVRAPSWPSSPSLRHVSAGHSNDAEEATDTSRSARASRRDVAGQPDHWRHSSRLTAAARQPIVRACENHANVALLLQYLQHMAETDLLGRYM